jgi:hypothetical protein
LFGELDTRLGRRWNLDPKPKTNTSPYSVFGNSPVFLTDVQLDTPSTTPQTGACEKCKPIGLENGDYLSDVQHQVFQADFNLNYRSFPSGMTPQQEWEDFRSTFSSDPGRIINNNLASYNLIDRDGSNGVSNGDHFDISILPDNGSVVVTSAIVLTNSVSVTVQTLQGHPDAGTNTLTANFDPITGVVHFQTENWSRTNDNAGGIAAGIGQARYFQQKQWGNVLGQAGISLGGPIVDANSYVQEYKFNDWTNKLGRKDGAPIIKDISRSVENYVPAGQLGLRPNTK